MATIYDTMFGEFNIFSPTKIPNAFGADGIVAGINALMNGVLPKYCFG